MESIPPESDPFETVVLLSDETFPISDFRDFQSLTSEYVQETGDDPWLFLVHQVSYEFCTKQFPNSLTLVKNKETAVGFSLLLPCTTSLMKDFLELNITETQMFYKVRDTLTREDVDAVYFCICFLRKAFRNRGILFPSTQLQVQRIMQQSKHKVFETFSWSFSDQGNKLATAVAKSLGLSIHHHVVPPPKKLDDCNL